MREFVKSLIIITMILMTFFLWTGLDVEFVDEEADMISIPCSRVLKNRDLFTPREFEYCAKLDEE